MCQRFNPYWPTVHYHSQANPKLDHFVQEDAGACMIPLPTNDRHDARIVHDLVARQSSLLALRAYSFRKLS